MAPRRLVQSLKFAGLALLSQTFMNPAAAGGPVSLSKDGCYVDVTAHTMDKNEYGNPVENEYGGGASIGCRLFRIGLPFGKALTVGGELQYAHTEPFTYDNNRNDRPVQEQVPDNLFVNATARFDNLLELGDFNLSPEVAAGTGALGAAVLPRGVTTPLDGGPGFVSDGEYTANNISTVRLGGCLSNDRMNNIEVCAAYQATRFDNLHHAGYDKQPYDHVHGTEITLRYKFGADTDHDR